LRVKGTDWPIFSFHRREFHPQERTMKKISYVLAALATIAIAAPAVAQDKAMEKPMDKPMMHHHTHHHVHMHHHMKKPMMDKKM
jgi:hypothetical protein